jgi:Zinc metalloprotease (elastase)
MKNFIPLIALLLLPAFQLSAQRSKPLPTDNNGQAPVNPQISWPGKAPVPLAPNPFNESVRPTPLAPLQKLDAPGTVAVTYAENGMPIFFEGETAASQLGAENMGAGERALAYCASLRPQGLEKPETEFTVSRSHTDEQGNEHVRLDQVFNGIPVWGAELVCHTRNGAFARMNGRYFPTPKLAATTPSLSAETAIETVKKAIGTANVQAIWTEEELQLIDGQPFSAQLVVYHLDDQLDGERLAWHVSARPDVMHRSEWFVDALSGAVLHHFENTCNVAGHRHEGHPFHVRMPNLHAIENTGYAMDGPATVQGLDLRDINRSFNLGGWQVGSQYVLIDASKPMYKPNSSNMPGDPVGVIWTLNAGNTSPGTAGFNLSQIVSNSTTYTNQKAAISAHYNSIQSYNYFKNKFNRNAIDGLGGNIIGVVNVSEPNGTGMDNAFWNGKAMFYGNGATTFLPLARGLDVGGHEMTHGVIEKTANLVYQGESGALNESFADVFGQMIDGDPGDWKIGEDVVKPGVSPGGCLRNMQDPHNNASSNSFWWQPNHTSEQYTGPNDNGGVHINSGITNRAYYLFATNAQVGNDKAEQVYYKALRDYLVKSSKFIDCRIAVIQAATDLYGAAVANAAASAFTTVGIGSGGQQGSTPLGQLQTNPGTDFVVATNNAGTSLNLLNATTGAVIKTLYNQGVASKVSITDDGRSLVFVNDAKHIIGIDLTYASNPPQHTVSQLSSLPEWRSVAISKDGRFVAGLADFQEPRIYVFDLASPFGDYETFFLYNPTYTQGQITGDVKYADVLEFDYSGNFLMYDAFNNLGGIGYWDIGFVEYWKNDQFTDGGNAFITKLFTALPEKIGIGNPTFAKNSPYVIAFDLIDESSNPTRYDLYGANAETGDYGIIVANNGNLGWPSYTKTDNRILYEKEASAGIYNLRLQPLNANKIQSQGNSTAFANQHYWGAWFANGTRKLQLSAHESLRPSLQVSVAPNPVADVARLTLNAEGAADALLSAHNLLGETVLSQHLRLQAGENQFEVAMRTLPAGSYVLRIVAENGAGAALKLVKE